MDGNGALAFHVDIEKKTGKVLRKTLIGREVKHGVHRLVKGRESLFIVRTSYYNRVATMLRQFTMDGFQIRLGIFNVHKNEVVPFFAMGIQYGLVPVNHAGMAGVQTIITVLSNVSNLSLKCTNGCVKHCIAK